MKTRNNSREASGIKFFVVMVALCGFAISALGTVLIDEKFESGYSRTANSISTTNMAWYKSRVNTLPTVNVGSVSFNALENNGSDMNFGYFTDAGANIAGVGTASSVSNGHLLLGVGDVLTVSISFYLGEPPADLTTYALRFGLFDNAVGRQTSDLNGGGSSTFFTNAPGFSAFLPMTSMSGTNDQISIRRHTTMTTLNILGTSADFTQIDGTVGGAYSPLRGLTNYTFKFSVGRSDASTWVLTASILDTLSQAVMTSGSVATNDGVSSFSWLAWHTPGMPVDTLGGPIVYTDLKVEVTNSPPVVSDPFAAWQTTYFGSTTNAQATGGADPDGDSLSNTNEFLAGFNPNNSSARLRIISIATSGNDVNVTYLGANGDNTWSPGIASRTNVLEFTTGTGDGSYSNNFVTTGRTNILSGGNGSGVVTNMVDTGGATNVPARYYRIRVLTP